jgi:hypothetical protein
MRHGEGLLFYVLFWCLLVLIFDVFQKIVSNDKEGLPAEDTLCVCHYECHSYLKIEYSSRSFPLASRSVWYCFCFSLFPFSSTFLSDGFVVLKELVF